MTEGNKEWGTVSLREYIESEIGALSKHTQLKFDAMDKALMIQAVEYERRLETLNNEHARTAQVYASTITQEKFEDYSKTEQDKRELALQRVDEKFEDYIKRYEQRQREIDLLLAASKGAADEAAKQAERIKYQTNRNIAILGLFLTTIVVVMNLIGAI